MATDKYGKPIQLYDIVLHHRLGVPNPLVGVVIGYTKRHRPLLLLYGLDDYLTNDTVIMRNTDTRSTLLSPLNVSPKMWFERNSLILTEYC